VGAYKLLKENGFQLLQNVGNPVIKSFLFLVDGKMIKQYIISVFHTRTMILSLLYSCWKL